MELNELLSSSFSFAGTEHGHKESEQQQVNELSSKVNQCRVHD
jgi:hypothetical protein